ncbi:uncharacterized protein Z518_03206 [Rhinocladiella mackenziei CBS 650.93]|uniref:PARP catalytic domain-containing protein n=1 Tax=Rhinocladiella mackenziei CBS 650.93 TaxID=1442369 RepID=A0A0D2JGV5_9EURO|nr:uncharacterized protein Z518_03206 [Rhinocladiella mackenziei CBS 650.93]KIX08550.1 hypothetical protein Z518_03206 [Rhinocladiella mackenziei CBS 650.93]
MGRHQNRWHRDIDNIRARLNAFDLNYGDSTFLAQLRKVTDNYLKKKKSLTCAQRSTRLTALIKAHHDKSVAISACGHMLNRPAVRDILMNEFAIRPNDDASVVGYLRAIIAVHRANPSIVCDVEERRARLFILLLLEDHDNLLRHLRDFFSFEDPDILYDLFPTGYIDATIHRLCSKFADRLRVFETSCQWALAFRAVEWLSSLIGISPRLEAILNSSLPHWRSWARWHPTERGLVTSQCLADKSQLLDVLALDGPDLIYQTHTSLLDGLLSRAASQREKSICHGQFFVWFDNDRGISARQFVNRVLSFLPGPRLPSRHAIDLFDHLCLRNAVDIRTLETLEKVAVIQDPDLLASVSDILTSPDHSVQMSAMINILNALPSQGSPGLLECLSPNLKDVAQNGITAMQDNFCELIQNQSNPQGIVCQLNSLAQILKTCPQIRDLLDSQFRSFLDVWPPVQEIGALLRLRADMVSVTYLGDPLTAMVDSYCMARIAGRGTIYHASQTAMEVLLRHWQQPPHAPHRHLVLSLISCSTFSSHQRLECVSQIDHVDTDYLEDIDTIVRTGSEMSCACLARLILSRGFSRNNDRTCWRALLHWMMKKRNSTLLEYSVSHMEVVAWFDFLQNLRAIFGSQSDLPTQELFILQPGLHCWSRCLESNYLGILLLLETKAEFKSLVEWILKGWQQRETVMKLLNFFQGDDDFDRNPILQAFTNLKADVRHADEKVWKVMASVTSTSIRGTEACLHILNLHQQSLRSMAEVSFFGWHQAGLTPADRGALRELAALLDLRPCPTRITEPETLQEASWLIERRYAETIKQAMGLGPLRTALERHDASWAKGFLGSLGIEEGPPSLAGTGIPSALVDVVDTTEDGLLEMCFPLDHLRPLQRKAMCLNNEESLLVIRMGMGDEQQSPRFCIHLHPEASALTSSHRYCDVRRGAVIPDLEPCHVSPNRAIYQLSRIVFRYLQSPAPSVMEAYEIISSAIDDLGHTCLVCSNKLSHPLIRSTTCQNSCYAQLRRSHLEHRVGDLRDNPAVVDLILSSIHASAAAGNDSVLLDGCPIQNSADILARLNRIPRLAPLASSGSLALSVRNLGRECEALLSWACISYRGFIVPATDLLKIPNMPGVKQFVLANTFPELEAKFAVKLGTSNRGASATNTRVVFHGTTLDRLYPILRNGLKIYSTPPLRQNGHAYGSGLYVAAEPVTSLSYARSGTLANASGWTKGTLRNHSRLVLGCELIDVPTTANPSSGVYVVRDMDAIIVRYIFLFPDNDNNQPVARHIVPAMQSSFASLRARSV